MQGHVRLFIFIQINLSLSKLCKNDGDCHFGAICLPVKGKCKDGKARKQCKERGI